MDYWLIKAGGRVVGPLTTKEVIESIQRRELLALDEIAPAFGRWTYFRDNPQFEPLLREVRNKSGASDEHTLTNTQTSTETMTDVLGTFGNTERLSEGIKEQLNQKEFNTEGASEEAPIVTVGSYYPIESHQKTKKLEVPRWTWAAAIVLALGMTWGLVQQKSHLSKNVTAPSEFRSLLREGLQASEVGDYNTAVRLLSKARQLRPDNLEVVLSLAPLMVMKHETVLARRMLEGPIKTEMGPSFQKRAQNVLALVALSNYDNAKAETHLDSALNADALFTPALVNRGIVHTLRKEHAKARQKFNEAQTVRLSDGILMLSLFENAVGWYQQTGDKKNLDEVDEKLGDFLKTSQDYRLEVRLARSYVQFLKEDSESSIETLKGILTEDPALTMTHVHDPQFFRERMGWGHIYSWFQRFYPSLDTEPKLVAVNGFVRFKSGKKIEGKKIIEDALLQAPDDPEIRTYLAYVQNVLGLIDEAEANLKLASLKGDSLLPHILKARFCENQSNFVCASDSWEKVHRLNPSSLQATAGVAWSEFRKKNVVGAKDLLSSGLRMSSNYRPLLLLKNEMANENVNGRAN